MQGRRTTNFSALPHGGSPSQVHQYRSVDGSIDVAGLPLGGGEGPQCCVQAVRQEDGKRRPFLDYFSSSSSSPFFNEGE